MKRLVLVLLVLPMVALADPEPWMKKDNPNALHATVRSEDDCPISEDDLRKIVGGVLVKSKIKLLAKRTVNELSLFIDLHCYERSESFWIVSSDVRFAKFYWDDFHRILMTTSFYGYGGVGQGDEDSIRFSVRISVKKAMTDYLKTNFDLGEGE